MKTYTLRIVYTLSFLLDAAIMIFLSFLGLNPVESIFCAEMTMWLARLACLDFAKARTVALRIAHAIPIAIAVVALGFLLIELAPGDVLSRMRLDPDVRPETIGSFERSFGLDRPWHERFALYVWNALHLDFGYSEFSKAPVFSVVRSRAFNTLVLAVTTLVVSWGVAVPLGLFAAVKKRRWQDRAASLFSYAGLSIPDFLLALILLLLIATTGAWLPVGGMESPGFAHMSIADKVVDVARHMVLPVTVLSAAMISRLVPLVRASALDVLGRQYVVAARAKGLSTARIVRAHVAGNALIPMISILGTQVGSLLSGAVVVEQVLAWPGLGKLILSATLYQDTYLVAGSLVYGVVLVVLGNLASDLVLAYTDPRIRL